MIVFVDDETEMKLNTKPQYKEVTILSLIYRIDYTVAYKMECICLLIVLMNTINRLWQYVTCYYEQKLPTEQRLAL